MSNHTSHIVKGAEGNLAAECAIDKAFVKKCNKMPIRGKLRQIFWKLVKFPGHVTLSFRKKLFSVMGYITSPRMVWCHAWLAALPFLPQRLYIFHIDIMNCAKYVEPPEHTRTYANIRTPHVCIHVSTCHLPFCQMTVTWLGNGFYIRAEFSINITSNK